MEFQIYPHFAQIDENKKVIQVLSITQEVIDTGAFGDPKTWIETDVNAFLGKSRIEGQNSFRKNYAGVGYTYDTVRDAFIPPPLYPSFILDENMCIYIPPIPGPNDGFKYDWNESTQSWVKI